MKNFRFGLIGNNVTYSKSADIFEAVFKQHNIDGTCAVYNILPDEFQSKFLKLTETEVDGLSVTIPYKKTVIEYLDDVAPIANAIQAVNSIRLIEGKKIGFNTDCYGLSYPLRKYAEKLKHSTALIIGAGGAAKAVVYALFTDYEIKDFTIIARNSKKLKQFKDSLLNDLIGITLNDFTFDEFSRQDRFSICVNCTPLGGWNMPDKLPFPQHFDLQNAKIYYDLNYNADNNCMKFAQSKTQHCLDGSSMLVAQALRSFYLWTGLKTDFKQIYTKVFGA